MQLNTLVPSFVYHFNDNESITKKFGIGDPPIKDDDTDH